MFPFDDVIMHTCVIFVISAQILNVKCWRWYQIQRHAIDYVFENDYSDHLVASSATLELRHNERDGVSNHRRLDSLLNRLFRRR